MTGGELSTLQRGDWIRFIGDPKDPRFTGLSDMVVKKKYTFQCLYSVSKSWRGNGYYFNIYLYSHNIGIHGDDQGSLTEQQAKDLFEVAASYFELIKRRHDELQSNYLQGRIRRTVGDVQKSLNQEILNSKNYVDRLMKEIPTHDLINFTKELTPEQQIVLKFLYNYTDIKDLAKFFKQEEEQ